MLSDRRRRVWPAVAGVLAVLLVLAGVAGAVYYRESRERQAQERHAAEQDALTAGADATIATMQRHIEEDHARNQRVIRKLNLQTKQIREPLTAEEAAELRVLVEAEAKEAVEGLGRE